jgi:hypothetical protein
MSNTKFNQIKEEYDERKEGDGPFWLSVVGPSSVDNTSTSGPVCGGHCSMGRRMRDLGFSLGIKNASALGVDGASSSSAK